MKILMKKMFQYQFYHLAAYLILGVILITGTTFLPHDQKRLWGMTVMQWTIFSWIFAGPFQAWVVILWRLEYHSAFLSSRFGKNGFTIFRAGFVILALLRLLPLVPISLLTQGSLNIPRWIAWIITALTTPFIIWGLYSVFAYFGINRAFGGDHFFEKYREKTLVKKGTFKYIPNSMYTIVLLGLYHPGLMLMSTTGLLAALIHHLFVWVHYFCTEKPDIKVIHSS